ncbi:B-box zinc finger protein [Halioxenophilus sp. WMMB6]|uniref:B-box zinc finger protein n=1 Tax=Halioxenophilus sp. WMMB6 TaxID=3073815 RepID=UPI00295EA6C6|nr:B-box zinc finger protein [Halioxenophilus sp. WMMB6]
MSHCKYHPLVPALFYCKHCQTHTCDKCCDEKPATNDDDGRRCFICNKSMTFLGAAHTVEPFWRRLDKIYRYPLSTQSLLVIAGASLLAVFGTYNLWFVLLPILLMTSYSFHCLEQTANGHLQAPNFQESFHGGFKLLLQLFVILFLAGGAISAAGRLLGAEMAFLLGLVMLFVVPAIIILLAINGNLAEAVSPTNVLRLISSSGAAYIIMLLFIFIMMASVEVLSALIGEGHRHIQFFAQNLISNYYTVVVFHLMGYLVFQKQDALGFYTADSDYTREPRSDTEIDLARIEVLVKEGYYQHALDLYRELLPKHAANLAMWEKCLRLMCRVGEAKQLARYADQFLPRLMARDDEFAVANIYREIIKSCPNYQPETPELAIRLGQIMMNLGDYRAVVAVLNNFHKQHTDKQLIRDAYMLLANALDRIPSLEHKAASYRTFLTKLDAKLKEEQLREAEHNPLARFNRRPSLGDDL